MDKKQRQELYLSYLREEGYKSEVDKDGDIPFKCRGILYYILIDGDDEKYFHMFLPHIWRIKSKAEYQIALEAANKINRSFKSGKIIVNENGDSASVDVGLYFKDTNEFSFFFNLMMDMLKAMAAEFSAEMKKEEFSDLN